MIVKLRETPQDAVVEYVWTLLTGDERPVGRPMCDYDSNVRGYCDRVSEWRVGWRSDDSEPHVEHFCGFHASAILRDSTVEIAAYDE